MSMRAMVLIGARSVYPRRTVLIEECEGGDLELSPSHFVDPIFSRESPEGDEAGPGTRVLSGRGSPVHPHATMQSRSVGRPTGGTHV